MLRAKEKEFGVDWKQRRSVLRAKDEGRSMSGTNGGERSILETKEKGRSALGEKKCVVSEG